jgi:hypothetical protein
VSVKSNACSSSRHRLRVVGDEMCYTPRFLLLPQMTRRVESVR